MELYLKRFKSCWLDVFASVLLIVFARLVAG